MVTPLMVLNIISLDNKVKKICTGGPFSTALLCQKSSFKWKYQRERKKPRKTWISLLQIASDFLTLVTDWIQSALMPSGVLAKIPNWEKNYFWNIVFFEEKK